MIKANAETGKKPVPKFSNILKKNAITFFSIA